MKLSFPLLLVAMAAALCISGTAVAQDLKIGAVNLNQLVMQSPQAKSARDAMESKFAKRKQELEALTQQLKEDIERLKRDGAVMSEQARQDLEESIRDQQRVLKIQRSSYQDDVRRAEREELQRLQKKLAEAIQQYAEDFDYDLIVGNGVLYASDKVDVTERLLQRLKAQANN